VLDNIGGLELVVLVLAALFIIGPERLPKVLSDGMRMLRKVRQMARTATSDLSRELGTNIELEDLHPKTFLRKHLLSEAEEEAIRKPFQEMVADVRGAADSLDNIARDVSMSKKDVSVSKKDVSLSKSTPSGVSASPADMHTPNGKVRRTFEDAT
jgi:sec-independent protein translocase protein TatB